MLKNIHYQLCADKTEQLRLEAKLALALSQRYAGNIAAFQQFIPSLLLLLKQHQPQQYSIFCTAQGQANLVDFANGNTLYGLNPEAEIATDTHQFLKAASYIRLTGTVSTEFDIDEQPKDIDLLVMFGLGAGYQLATLLEQLTVKNLIVYEPAEDLFASSVQLADWQRIFSVAASKGTAVFLQIGKDGSSIADDLKELSQAVAFDKVYLYRHYSHPVMDKVLHYLQQHNGNGVALLNNKLHFGCYNHLYDEVALRHANTVISYPVTVIQDEETSCYTKNIAALKTYYPEILEAVLRHHNAHWQLVRDHKGQLNLWHPERKALFYNDIETESVALVEHFAHYPYQDDVFLAQKTSWKLRTYLHFTQMRKVIPVVDKLLQHTGQLKLPEEVDSLIIFGIALGQHIKVLTERYQIQHLYICEPNLDFFVASLHVTDWAGLLHKAAEQEQRIYFNLGGDGSQFFHDLTRQFYQVGAYSVINTYLLTSYYNSLMQKAINELRDNLKVMLAIGEYYDVARYGISHTYATMSKGCRFLTNNPDTLQHKALQLPVFIVGNGPSLDSCFEYLKMYREKILIISCGTALRALHKQGICPDFHAEVEIHRSTYDWVSQVKDPTYLKQIRLLSTNGVHPDTAALFKETLLCFKEGEASTELFRGTLPDIRQKFDVLKFAYPTVTNLAVNIALETGFQTLYLIGIDLGYADVNYHHSKSSAYYNENGKSLYDYQQVHGGGLPVPGNFLPLVFTKPEFDVSRRILEKTLASSKKKHEVYNCSNGVRINGTIPLLPDNILLMPLSGDKETLLQDFISNAYFQADQRLAEKIFSLLDRSLFQKTITDWLNLLQNVQTIEQAKHLIRQQWQFVLNTTQQLGNPAFILLYGSTNYFSAVLLKLVGVYDDKTEDVLQAFNQVLAIWREYLTEAARQFVEEPLRCDDISVEFH